MNELIGIKHQIAEATLTANGWVRPDYKKVEAKAEAPKAAEAPVTIDVGSVSEPELIPQIIKAFGGDEAAARAVVNERLTAMQKINPIATFEAAQDRLAWGRS